MALRLKKLTKNERHPPIGGECAVPRCKAMSTIGYKAGVAFPVEKGDLALCDVHNAKLEAETDEAAETTAPAVVTAGPGVIGPAVAAAPPESTVIVPAGTYPVAAALAPAKEETALVPPAEFRAGIKAEETEAKEALDLIREFEIVKQEDYDFANEVLGDAKTSWKALDARKKKATDPLTAALKEIRSWFKPPQTFYAEAEILLKAKLAEAHRKAAEAQDVALLAVQEAHAAGDAPAVRQALVQSEASEIQQADNVSIAEIWDFEVVDPAAVPREFLAPDLQKIQGVVRTMQADTNIPGVRAFPRDSVTRRGA